MSKYLKLGAKALVAAVVVKTVSDVVIDAIDRKRTATLYESSDPETEAGIADATQSKAAELKAQSETDSQTENKSAFDETKENKPVDDKEPVVIDKQTTFVFLFVRPPLQSGHKRRSVHGADCYGENEL